MNLSAIVGLFLGICCILIGNFLEDGQFSALLQLTAAIIVFGGTLGATLLSNSWDDIKIGVKMLAQALKSDNHSIREQLVKELVNCAKIARRESLLSVEPELKKLSDPYLQNVMRLIVDGAEIERIKDIFSTEIHVSEQRQLQAAKIWSDAGGFAPTVGIIGAVLGLIHVMANLTNTSELGKGIAVAFVATIYGVGSANLIFIPIANKLKRKIRHDSELKEMIIEGATSIQSGMSPYLIEEKLRVYSKNI